MARNDDDRRRPAPPHAGGGGMLHAAVALALAGALLLAAPVLFSGAAAQSESARGLWATGVLMVFAGTALAAAHWRRQSRAVRGRRRRAPPEDAVVSTITLENPRVDAQAPADGSPAPLPDKLVDGWSLDLLRRLPARGFEVLCVSLFGQGYEARSRSHDGHGGAPAGVDIWLLSRDVAGPAAVLRCAHDGQRQADVPQLQAFADLLAAQGLQRGTYCTSSTFTAEALRFGRDGGLNLIDGGGLLQQIAQQPPARQLSLLELAQA